MRGIYHAVSCALALLCHGCDFSENSAPKNQIDSQTWFQDEGRRRGIDFVHTSGARGDFLLPEIMGSGVALIDVENDGDVDIYFVQSGNLEAPPPDPRNPNALYLNDGNGYFAQGDGGHATTNLGYGMGVSVGDFDNDGYEDMYVTNVGPNVLLKNLGDGTFMDVTEQAKVGDRGWGTSSAFADFDLDGDLDLFVVNYIRWSVGFELECYHTTLGNRDYCGPALYRSSAQDKLFENLGDGTFQDATLDAGLMNVVGNGLGVVVEDFNGDSLPDVFVANDISPNHLWINQGHFEFVEECVRRGCAADEHGSIKAGMGVVAEDVDNDLDSDILIVNLIGETDTLFRNDRSFFVDITSQVGLGSSSQRHTRFGLAMVDFDHDGHFDIYHANGAISMSLEPEILDPYAEPDVTYRGDAQGQFHVRVEQMPVFTSRGLATGDVDSDGDIDVVVVNRGNTASLYVNQLVSLNNWVQFDIRNESGSAAIGAVVHFDAGGKRSARTVQMSGSYLSARSPVIHVGLGTVDKIENVEFTWLDGTSTSRKVLNAGSRWLISKP